ncbi:hypothetical protein [Paenibacillus sp. PDC88]|uniref:hypothetical protein n=1 Tax=Paenibacillus sp. PDC88 TaxID=1884375 RepID=UPI000894FA7F|nr:hypothetical protein [Paenibacillus sp. PDC88]SDW69347.1 hypothetical protein SAMN05518848_102708 [Paenibacillus sp. PDC88]
MIIAILDEHNTAAYYDVIEEVGHNLQALQYEFDRFLSSLEGNHPFRSYTEIVECNGEVIFADYVNTYGPDQLIAWINVEKYNARVAVRIKNTDALKPEAKIYI